MTLINSNNLKDRDLLVICPTRERPEKLARMYDSFVKTKFGRTSLILCVDVDDATEYDYNCTISVEPHKNNTQIINDIFCKFPDYKYYSVTNDDFIYKTMSWDTMLMQKGINFGEDGTNRKFPVTSVIDGDIVRALGWLQMPTLEYLYGDTVWNILGYQADCLKYNKDVIIEHDHFLFGAKSDNIYEKTNHKDQYTKDNNAFANWLRDNFQNDLLKIKRAYDKT